MLQAAHLFFLLLSLGCCPSEVSKNFGSQPNLDCLPQPGTAAVVSHDDVVLAATAALNGAERRRLGLRADS